MNEARERKALALEIAEGEAGGMGHSMNSPTLETASEDWLDEDGYPTDAAEKRVRDWSHDDFAGLMAFVKSIWRYSEYWDEEAGSDIIGKPVIRHHVSTAGWSGNESLIQALKENTMFWLMCWEQSRRGGHYIFAIKP